MESNEFKSIEITKLPDETEFYSYSQISKVFGEIKRKEIQLSDAILILLNAQPDNPIFGRISLMKQMYLLLNEELRSEDVQDGNFVPYYYGWFSFQIINNLKNLEYLGYIEKKGKKNTRNEQFRISGKGKKFITPLFSSLPEEAQENIRDKRKGWDQLGCDGILNYVYSKYPDSKERSKLKERYKSIKWGRSKA